MLPIEILFTRLMQNADQWDVLIGWLTDLRELNREAGGDDTAFIRLLAFHTSFLVLPVSAAGQR